MQSSEAAAAAAASGAIAADIIGPAAIWAHLDVGAPSNVIIWVVIGAAAGVWNKRIKHKGNLAGAFLASFCLTLGLLVWLPPLIGWKWDNAGMQAAAGLIVAFTSQNWGPKFMRALDKLDFTDALRATIANWIRPSRGNNDDRP